MLIASSAVSLTLCILAVPPAPVNEYRERVRVKAPTRLDWEFAVSGFGPAAGKLPADYRSADQQYVLYVPKRYDANKLWPLIVFISPGDDPMGWRPWQAICQRHGLLFCAAYGAGNNIPPAQRTRIVLDMLDDVRRNYRVDPDQTYLTGFSGGGRMACAIAFALPEYFGGVMPTCGTNPLPRLDYLRQRVHDRLAIAFVTGATDFNRRENEDYMAPLCRELDMHSRLWVAPDVGHAMPPSTVLAEAYDWLAQDLKRRRDDAKQHPTLLADPERVWTDQQQAERHLEAARAELEQPDQTYRGVAILQGIVNRWGATDAGQAARAQLKKIASDETLLARIEMQGGNEERTLLVAQARALERFGEMRGALEAWSLLLKNHPESVEGKLAASALLRLKSTLAEAPFLGLRFVGETNVIEEVVDGSPAASADLKVGDKIIRIGTVKVASLAQVQREIQGLKPGDQLSLERERAGKVLTISVTIGSVP